MRRTEDAWPTRPPLRAWLAGQSPPDQANRACVLGGVFVRLLRFSATGCCPFCPLIPPDFCRGLLVSLASQPVPGRPVSWAPLCSLRPLWHSWPPWKEALAKKQKAAIQGRAPASHGLYQRPRRSKRVWAPSSSARGPPLRFPCEATMLTSGRILLLRFRGGGGREMWAVGI